MAAASSSRAVANEIFALITGLYITTRIARSMQNAPMNCWGIRSRFATGVRQNTGIVSDRAQRAV
jgi:hypothetical protein